MEKKLTINLGHDSVSLGDHKFRHPSHDTHKDRITIAENDWITIPVSNKSYLNSGLEPIEKEYISFYDSGIESGGEDKFFRCIQKKFELLRENDDFFKNNIKRYFSEYDWTIIESDSKKLAFITACAYELDKIAEKIKRIENLIDPDTIAEEYLPYLAYLLGYQIEDYTIASFNIRQFVKNIIHIYSYKGTMTSFKQFFLSLGYDVSVEDLWWDGATKEIANSPQKYYYLKSWNELAPEKKLELRERIRKSDKLSPSYFRASGTDEDEFYRLNKSNYLLVKLRKKGDHEEHDSQYQTIIEEVSGEDWPYNYRALVGGGLVEDFDIGDDISLSMADSILSYNESVTIKNYIEFLSPVHLQSANIRFTAPMFEIYKMTWADLMWGICGINVIKSYVSKTLSPFDASISASFTDNDLPEYKFSWHGKIKDKTILAGSFYGILKMGDKQFKIFSDRVSAGGDLLATGEGVAENSHNIADQYFGWIKYVNGEYNISMPAQYFYDIKTNETLNSDNISPSGCSSKFLYVKNSNIIEESDLYQAFDGDENTIFQKTVDSGSSVFLLYNYSNNIGKQYPIGIVSKININATDHPIHVTASVVVGDSAGIDPENEMTIIKTERIDGVFSPGESHDIVLNLSPDKMAKQPHGIIGLKLSFDTDEGVDVTQVNFSLYHMKITSMAENSIGNGKGDILLIYDYSDLYQGQDRFGKKEDWLTMADKQTAVARNFTPENINNYPLRYDMYKNMNTIFARKYTEYGINKKTEFLEPGDVWKWRLMPIPSGNTISGWAESGYDRYAEEIRKERSYRLMSESLWRNGTIIREGNYDNNRFKYKAHQKLFDPFGFETYEFYKQISIDYRKNNKVINEFTHDRNALLSDIFYVHPKIRSSVLDMTGKGWFKNAASGMGLDASNIWADNLDHLWTEKPHGLGIIYVEGGDNFDLNDNNDIVITEITPQTEYPPISKSIKIKGGRFVIDDTVYQKYTPSGGYYEIDVSNLEYETNYYITIGKENEFKISSIPGFNDVKLYKFKRKKEYFVPQNTDTKLSADGILMHNRMESIESVGVSQHYVFSLIGQNGSVVNKMLLMSSGGGKYSNYIKMNDNAEGKAFIYFPISYDTNNMPQSITVDFWFMAKNNWNDNKINWFLKNHMFTGKDSIECFKNGEGKLNVSILRGQGQQKIITYVFDIGSSHHDAKYVANKFNHMRIIIDPTRSHPKKITVMINGEKLHLSSYSYDNNITYSSFLPIDFSIIFHRDSQSTPQIWPISFDNIKVFSYSNYDVIDVKEYYYQPAIDIIKDLRYDVKSGFNFDWLYVFDKNELFAKSHVFENMFPVFFNMNQLPLEEPIRWDINNAKIITKFVDYSDSGYVKQFDSGHIMSGDIEPPPIKSYIEQYDFYQPQGDGIQYRIDFGGGVWTYTNTYTPPKSKPPIVNKNDIQSDILDPPKNNRVFFDLPFFDFLSRRPIRSAFIIDPAYYFDDVSDYEQSKIFSVTESGQTFNILIPNGQTGEFVGTWESGKFDYKLIESGSQEFDKIEMFMDGMDDDGKKYYLFRDHNTNIMAMNDGSTLNVSCIMRDDVIGMKDEKQISSIIYKDWLSEYYTHGDGMPIRRNGEFMENIEELRGKLREPLLAVEADDGSVTVNAAVPTRKTAYYYDVVVGANADIIGEIMDGLSVIDNYRNRLVHET